MRVEPHIHAAAKARLALTAGRALLAREGGSPPGRTLARRSARLPALGDLETLETWTLSALVSEEMRQNWFRYAAAARLAHDIAAMVRAPDRAAISGRVDAAARQFALENRMLARAPTGLSGDAFLEAFDGAAALMETVWCLRLPAPLARLFDPADLPDGTDETKLQACLYAAEVHLRRAGGVLV